MKVVYKPEYWSEMLAFFANRQGLSGQSIVSSVQPKEILDVPSVIGDTDQDPEDEDENEPNIGNEGLDELVNSATITTAPSIV